MPSSLAQVRKALVAAVTFLTNLVALGVVPDAYVPYVVALVSALGVYGVYTVENAPTD